MFQVVMKMNKLLHVADMYLSYKRGKQTGLWGLFGILLTLVLVASWKYIAPLFEKIGLVALYDRLGLIREGAPALTAVYIIVFSALAIYVLLFVIFIGLLLFMLVVNFLDNLGSKAEKKVSLDTTMIAIQIILFPILLVIILFYTLIHLPSMFLQAIRDVKEMRRNPKGYRAKQKEANRLFKNHALIDYLQYKCVNLNKREKEFFDEVDRTSPEGPVVLSVEQAAQRLNRLPIKGDHFFLIGISYDRDIYLLAPRPHTPYTTSTPNTFIGEKWNLYGVHSLRYDYFGNKKNTPSYGIVWELTQFERECEYPKLPNWAEFDPEKHKMNEYDMNIFEIILDPREHYDIMSELKEYLKYCHYQHYIEEQQDLYFRNKQRILEKMDNAKDREEFMAYAEELKHFTASNEDVVKMIWEGSKNDIKG